MHAWHSKTGRLHSILRNDPNETLRWQPGISLTTKNAKSSSTSIVSETNQPVQSLKDKETTTNSKINPIHIKHKAIKKRKNVKADTKKTLIRLGRLTLQHNHV